MSNELIQAIYNYLMKQPYAEVAPLVKGIEDSLKPQEEAKPKVEKTEKK